MIYITVGLPGSGKSTWAKQFAREKGVPYLNTDELSESIFGKVSGPDMTYKIFPAIVETFMKGVPDVVVDSCNVSKANQIAWEKLFYNSAIEWHFFETSLLTCLELNFKRGTNGGRRAPESMIESMAQTLNKPSNSIIHKYNGN